MAVKNRWQRTIVLALAVFVFLFFIALAEVFFPLFKPMALEFSVLIFIGFLGFFLMGDLFLVYFAFLFVKSSPVRYTALRGAACFLITGLGISILLKCLYVSHYLFIWRFLPGLFYDLAFVLSDIATYTPFMFFFYFFHRQLKKVKGRRMRAPVFLSFLGAFVIVLLNCTTLFSLLFPGSFSWFFTIEFSIFITLPRALAFFSFLYFFFTFLRVYKNLPELPPRTDGEILQKILAS